MIFPLFFNLILSFIYLQKWKFYERKKARGVFELFFVYMEFDLSIEKRCL
jgi:hypothetical protein